MAEEECFDFRRIHFLPRNVNDVRDSPNNADPRHIYREKIVRDKNAFAQFSAIRFGKISIANRRASDADLGARFSLGQLIPTERRLLVDQRNLLPR